MRDELGSWRPGIRQNVIHWDGFCHTKPVSHDALPHFAGKLARSCWEPDAGAGHTRELEGLRWGDLRFKT